MRSRRAQVTDEPLRVAPALLGRTLASPWRRGVGLAVDVLLWGAIAIPLLMVLAMGALYLQAPGMARAVTAVLTGDGGWGAVNENQAELLRLVQKRRPDVLPTAIAEALDSGDPERLDQATEGISLDFRLDGETRSSYDLSRQRLHMRSDVLYGPLASVLSFLAVALREPRRRPKTIPRVRSRDRQR